MLKKKIWANFQRIIELFTKKIVTKLSKIWVWDPGSGKNQFRIPDPGTRGQKCSGSRIRIRIRKTYCKVRIVTSKRLFLHYMNLPADGGFVTVCKNRWYYATMAMNRYIIFEWVIATIAMNRYMYSYIIFKRVLDTLLYCRV
jgi:hypothetical protein